MAKRVGDSLDQDNYQNDDDQQEEAGTFGKASEDVLQRRIIKKPKSRLTSNLASASASASAPVFGGSSNTGMFSFNLPGNNASSIFSTASGTTSSVFSTASGTASSPFTTTTPAVSASTAPSTNKNGDILNLARELISLNKSFESNIVKEVQADPFSDLSWICSEYRKKRDAIKEKYEGNKPPPPSDATMPVFAFNKIASPTTTATPISTATATATTASNSSFSFQKQSADSSSSSSGNSNIFGFSVSTNTPGPTTIPTPFSFGGGGASKFGAGGSGGTAGVFSGLVPPPTTSSTISTGATNSSASTIDNQDNSAAADDVDEPPVDEQIDTSALKTGEGEEHEETLHAVRAKIFNFVDKDWKLIGVGELKVNKSKTDGKSRILIRADMGQVLLNVRIFSQMPLNKVNDGNVSFVTPNEKGELVKYLVRVKAPSAIDLFSILLKEAK